MRALANRVAATSAAKNFGTLVDRVRDEGATFLIERHGHVVAQIGPVSAVPRTTLRRVAAYLKRAPKLDEQMLRFVEEGIAAANRPAVPHDPWQR
jgi:antitoxin (DNA-binding transcriptional repressor) of toxin-antitoxin stability system